MIYQNLQKSNRWIEPKRFLLVAVFAVSILLLLQVQQAQAGLEDFKIIDPEKIEIKSSEGYNEKVQRTLTVLSTEDISGIVGTPSELIEVNNNQFAISGTTLLIPEKFDLTASVPQQVNVTFDLSDVNAGNYKGRIMFISSPNNMVEIPVTLEISAPIFIPLIPLILG